MSQVAVWRQPVIRVPLTQAFPELEQVKEFRSKVCLFNADRTKLFDVVSPKYQLVEHARAVDTVDTALRTYFGAEVASSIRSLNGGASIRAEFKLPVKPIKLSRTDINEVTLVLRNSYDRTCTFQAVLGAFRLICSNGMKIGDTYGEIKVRHIAGADDDQDIVEYIDTMVKNVPRLKETWEQWADEKVEHVVAQAMLGGKFPDKYLKPVLDEARFPRTKWDLYNDLTRFATHDTKSVQRRMQFDDVISNVFYGVQA